MALVLTDIGTMAADVLFWQCTVAKQAATMPLKGYRMFNGIRVK